MFISLTGCILNTRTTKLSSNLLYKLSTLHCAQTVCTCISWRQKNVDPHSAVATGSAVSNSNLRADKRFSLLHTRPDRHRDPPTLSYNGQRGSFSGVKRPRGGFDHPPHLPALWLEMGRATTVHNGMLRGHLPEHYATDLGIQTFSVNFQPNSCIVQTNFRAENHFLITPTKYTRDTISAQ
jgi:hypothetical protein